MQGFYDGHKPHRHSRFLQAHSRHRKFGRGRRKWVEIKEGPVCRLVCRSYSLWACLTVS